MAQSGYIIVEVDDPNFNKDHEESQTNTRTTKALYNPNANPVATYHRLNYLNDTQAAVGIRFLRLFVMSGRSGTKAVDFMKEPVDGGGWKDNFSDKMANAGNELDRVKRRLGPDGYELMEAVCGECKFLKQIVIEHHDRYTKRYESVLMTRLRNCLDTLAIDWEMENTGTIRRRPGY